MATITINTGSKSVEITNGSNTNYYSFGSMSISSSSNNVEIWSSGTKIISMIYGTDTITINGDATFADLAEFKSALNNALNVDNSIVGLAVNEIGRQYGDVVSVVQKGKTLRKWGRNESIGTSEATVMTLPSGVLRETLLSSNGITSVSSTSASDTQNLILSEGQTLSGGNFTFSKDTTTVALTGQTDATLNTALARSTRARLSSPAVGTIYFHEGGATTGGVPDDLTTVHMMITPGEIQTQKASTSISQVDYWIITDASVSCLEKSAAWVSARIEIKPLGDTYFYPVTEWVNASDSSGKVNMLGSKDFVIVPKNYDVRVTAFGSGANIDTACAMSGPLAILL